MIAVGAASAADISDLTDDSLVPDDGEVLAAENDVLLAEDGEAPEINVTTKETPYNERASVEVNLKANATRPVVNIYVDGDAVKNLTIYRNGKGTYYVPANTYDVGDHTVEATYDDPDYGLISNSAVLTITPVTPIVGVNDVTVHVGELVTVPFTVTDNKGRGMAGKARVTIYLADGNVSKIVEFNDTSKFNFDISKLFNGTSMNMSGLFNGSNFNISGVFNSSGFNISGLFNGTTFNMSGMFNTSSMFNGTGFNMTSLNITGLLNGTGLNVSALFNGTGLNITGLFNGTGLNLSGIMDGTGLNLTGLFNGTDFSSFFNGTDFSSLFNVTSFDFSSITKKDSADTLASDASDDVLAAPALGVNGTGDKSNFDFSSFSAGNSSNFNISAILDGLGIDLSSIFGGKAKEHNATFDYPFEPGTYRMSVEYLGDGNYESVTNDSAKLTVLGDIDLVAYIVPAKKPGEDTNVDAFLYNETGEPIAYAIIRVILNGEDMGIMITDKLGHAHIGLFNLTAGHYVLNLIYGNLTRTFEFDVEFDKNTTDNSTDNSTENHTESKSTDKNATGNPVALMLLSALAIIGCSLRRKD